MDVKIVGGKSLKGTITVSGAKNASIPIVCASLLAKGKVLLHNVPRISDIFDLIEIIKRLQCKVVFKGHTMLIDNTNLTYQPLLFEECQRIRGSYYLIGVFLTLFSKCEIILPGGCKIGSRPIDIHLQAFQDLGFDYSISDGVLYTHKIKSLEEAHITLKNKSVGASINAMFASLGLKRVTIDNLLLEPEGEDVLLFLNQLGYPVEYVGGVFHYQYQNLEFKLTKHMIIPDRIEAMTYVVLGLLTGNILVKKVKPDTLKIPLQILLDSGFDITVSTNEIRAKKSIGKPFQIRTDIYPAFPTDLQSIFGVLAVQTNGTSEIEETVFENRMHIYYDLIDSGIHCHVSNNRARVEGSNTILSKNYKAYDLRQGAALVLLSLMSDGTSQISNFEYILRGYEDILSKLKSIGATIYQA